MRKELTGLFLFFLVVLTSLSLYSYSPADPSINNHVFSSQHGIQNLFGLVGAHLSGILVGLFGLGAFWVPVLLVLCSVWYLKGRPSRIMLLTLWGGLLLIVSTGSLLALIQDQFVLGGRLFSSGGFIGMPLKVFLLRYTNPAGTVIVLVLLFCVGLVLSTGISIITFFLILKQGFVSGGRALTRKAETAGVQTASVIANGVKNWQEQRKEKLKEIVLSPQPAVAKKETVPPDPPVAAAEPAARQGGAPPPVVTPILSSEPSRIFEPVMDDIRDRTGFVLPPLSLLNDKKRSKSSINIDLLREKGEVLTQKLNDFGIVGEVVEIQPGPVITTFEYRPAPGVKISKIVNLTDDLALALRALSIRIVAPIPGKDVVGVEIPNDKREMVLLRELLCSTMFIEATSKLTLALGKDILGAPVTAPLDVMPHLLIAGATGTGKSVGLNSMIISLLYKSTPDEVKFIMIDPKRIELSVYDGIPHLISPVVTDMKKATNALFWGVREMERRYELLAESGVRNILQYNEMIERDALSTAGSQDPDDEPGDPPAKLPYIVVVVDEFADLMMVASRDVESALIRLAQMARAAGIHLILATQRPSVDVLTGVIKANFPTRISFQVSSRIDSRTILDSNGSERLLGNGDMLFLPPGTGRLQRIQGAYISEAEIARVTDFLKRQQQPDYLEDITEKAEDGPAAPDESEYDEKYDEAVALVTRTRQASISSVQRHLRIGYNRAARIIEMMEIQGIIGPSDGSKPREVLVRDYDDN
ncbi:MAG: DNA translocase FtsK 4TM domain-containing protein [Pseudomonadota bacterium]